jgi:hypothetical protein
MIRNIYLKYEVDFLRNEKVIVKNILLHQNFDMKSGQGRGGKQDSSPYTLYSRAKNEQRVITPKIGKPELRFFCTAHLPYKIYLPTLSC